MKVHVNGEAREVPTGVTIAALLQALQLPADQVAVELNAEVVRRAKHSEVALREGDRVEVVTFVGGG